MKNNTMQDKSNFTKVTYFAHDLIYAWNIAMEEASQVVEQCIALPKYCAFLFPELLWAISLVWE